MNVAQSDSGPADAMAEEPARSGRQYNPHHTPGALRIGMARGRLEVIQLLRSKEAFFFVLLFPLLLLVLFATIFEGNVPRTDVPYQQVFASGIIASGVMAAGFQTLGVSVAVERHDGTLQRLRGTPMPKTAYFIGKIILVLGVTLAQLVTLLSVAALVFDLDLPSGIRDWATFTWVSVLGAMSCSLMGIAVSGLARSAKAASPVVMIPFVVLQFISGVYFLYNDLPGGLQRVAALFPLKWMTQGMRSVFLPDSYQRVEPAGSWELDAVFVMLVAWIIVGLVTCLLAFRWDDRGR